MAGESEPNITTRNIPGNVRVYKRIEHRRIISNPTLTLMAVVLQREFDSVCRIEVQSVNTRKIGLITFENKRLVIWHQRSVGSIKGYHYSISVFAILVID